MALSSKNNRYKYKLPLESTPDSIAFSSEEIFSEIVEGYPRRRFQDTVPSTTVWPSGHSESRMADTNYEEYAVYVLADINTGACFIFRI